MKFFKTLCVAIAFSLSSFIYSQGANPYPNLTIEPHFWGELNSAGDYEVYGSFIFSGITSAELATISDIYFEFESYWYIGTTVNSPLNAIPWAIWVECTNFSNITFGFLPQSGGGTFLYISISNPSQVLINCGENTFSLGVSAYCTNGFSNNLRDEGNEDPCPLGFVDMDGGIGPNDCLYYYAEIFSGSFLLFDTGTLYNIEPNNLLNGDWSNCNWSDDIVNPGGDFNPPIAINNESQFSAISYPNPFTDKLFIDIESQTGLNVYLYNIHGELMFFNDNITTRNIQIETSNFPAGIYILKMDNGKEIFKKKFIKT